MSPLEQLRQCKHIARAHGYYIVERGPYEKRDYVLYRDNSRNDLAGTGRGVRVGKRSTIEGIDALVRKVTGFV